MHVFKLNTCKLRKTILESKCEIYINGGINKLMSESKFRFVQSVFSLIIHYLVTEL